MKGEPPVPRSFESLFGAEPFGPDRLQARLDSHGGLSFGGQTLGCATLAAARSCPGRPVHSLHACFLRPVPPEVPVELHVESLSDGRRIARRRVSVRIEDRLRCELVVSFAAAGRGPEYQQLPMQGGTPPPEGLPSEREIAEEEGWDREGYGPGSIEWRWVGAPWRPAAPDEDSGYRAWVRPTVEMPADDAGLRAATIAYLADFHSHWPVVRRGHGDFQPVGFVSLDQVVWLHRDVPWDDWWLLSSGSDVAFGGRALGRRTLHTRDGRLVASMAQESLIPGAAGPE